MGGNEVRDDACTPSVTGADLLELRAQAHEQLERRLGDVLQNLVLGVFRGYFHSS